VKKSRRNHSPAFTARVALAALAGNKTVAEITQHYQVHPNYVSTWQAQLVERATQVFGAAIRHVGMAAEQLPNLDRWRALLPYMCHKVVITPCQHQRLRRHWPHRLNCGF
jgi:transposase-like protein